MIRKFGDTIGSGVFRTLGRAVGRTQEHRPLPVDLLESDDAYLAVFDAPGALGTDVQVRYERGEVVVRVDRFREFRDDFEMQFPGRGLSLDGRVSLPEDAAVDPASATATLKTDGTLYVHVPRITESGEDDASESGETETQAHEIEGHDAADSDSGESKTTDSDNEASDEART